MPPRRRAILLCGPARAPLAAIARELAGREAHLLVQAAPREVAAADRLCRSLARRGGAAQVVPAALRGDDDARQLVAQAWKAARAIDTVVICPALSTASATRDPSLDAWQASLAIGLRAPFFLAKQAGLRMATPGGRLIFAFAAPPRGAGAAAGVVHAGLLCMIEALGKALPSRVAVNAVIGGGRSPAAGAAQIARGVRVFSAADRPVGGAVLDLAAAVHEG
jgi:NAD(P)-dependent dehydrogenase (short-subunit alcohol dehydrogenase family)